MCLESPYRALEKEASSTATLAKPSSHYRLSKMLLKNELLLKVVSLECVGAILELNSVNSAAYFVLYITNVFR